MDREDVCSKIAGQREVSFFLSFAFYASMFFRWMLLQESVVEGHRAAVAPGLQRLPGRIHLQNQPNPLRPHPSHFHNLPRNRKAAFGGV
jgi:hypothetical protein